MGGDGGVVATNRRYLRGAGAADKVGNSTSGGSGDPADVQRNQERQAYEILTTCALTKHKLSTKDKIVACRYGRLYLKEAAIQALLERKANKSSPSNALDHVAKLSELYEVRGQFDDSKTDEIAFVCPVTAKPLQGKVPPAMLLVPGHPEQPNVVSAFAGDNLPPQEFQQEYGPIDMKIKLAPTPEELQKVKEELEQERAAKQEKKKKKKKDKRKLEAVEEEKKSEVETSQKKSKPTLNSEIKSRVESALESNPVLSSLYVDKKKK